MIFTTNMLFGAWVQMFGDTKTTLLDCVTHNCGIPETGNNSDRFTASSSAIPKRVKFTSLLEDDFRREVKIRKEIFIFSENRQMQCRNNYFAFGAALLFLTGFFAADLVETLVLLTEAVFVVALLLLVVFLAGAFVVGFFTAFALVVPPFAALAAISSKASSRVISSGDMLFGRVALILP